MPNDEVCCEYGWQCEAPSGAREITNCIHCGKELHEKNGWWFTWDAYMHKNPKPQGPVVPVV